KPLSDYVRFAKVFLILVAITGLTRLALSLNGAPNTTARWFSMTVVVWIGLVYYAVRVHTTGFGSYKQLLPVVAILNIVAQTIAIVGILPSIFTGQPNVFSAPEYSVPNQWLHASLHVVIGMTLGSLIPWGIGSGILALTRRARKASYA